MNTKKITTAFGAGLLALAAATTVAPAAFAASDTAQQATSTAGRIIAQDPSQLLQASPSAPRAITVHAEPGAKVTVQPTNGKGKVRTAKANDDGIAAFKKLAAGREYAVNANGERTTVIPVIAVGAAAGLTARTTDTPTAIDLTWEHRATPARGGESITYRVTATPINPATGKQVPESHIIEQTVGTTEVTLSGLDPQTVYEFRVTPINALGEGYASVARMSEPLISLVPSASAPITQQPVTPVQPRKPAPNPAPAPAPSPGTRTIWVCPDGFAEVGSSCQKTAAYTYSTQDYTFHDEVQTKAYTFHTETTGPAPIISEFSTENVCPSGYNLEDYGAQGKLCRQYGPAPTAQVKDAAPSGWTDNGSSYVRTVEVKDNAPAGFTDDGTQWIKKDAAPSGWSDDGTQYVKTTAKVARTVPA